MCPPLQGRMDVCPQADSIRGSGSVPPNLGKDVGCCSVPPYPAPSIALSLCQCARCSLSLSLAPGRVAGTIGVRSPVRRVSRSPAPLAAPMRRGESAAAAPLPYLMPHVRLLAALCPGCVPSCSRCCCWGCTADTHNKARLGWGWSGVPAGGCEEWSPGGGAL